MNRLSSAVVLWVMTAGLTCPALANEDEARGVIDKAIKAMGGEEKLSAIKAFSVKGKGQITIEGNDYDFTFQMTALGSDRYRSTYEVEAGGTKFAGGTVLDGDKGWRKQEGEVKKLEGRDLAIEKRNAYLDVIPTLLLPLKDKSFKLDSADDEKVGGKPASVVRVVGPEGKEFTLAFDKVSGLPVKMSGPVADEKGNEEIHETIFEDYKEVRGIMVSTSSRIKRGGKKYIEIEGLEFQPLPEVEAGTFAEPR